MTAVTNIYTTTRSVEFRRMRHGEEYPIRVDEGPPTSGGYQSTGKLVFLPVKDFATRAAIIRPTAADSSSHCGQQIAVSARPKPCLIPVSLAAAPPNASMLKH